MTGHRIVLIGGGSRAFREYALAAVAARAEVVLLSGTEAGWERQYCAESAVVDLADVPTLTAVARSHAPDGVLTYDERCVEAAAQVAATLGLPGPAPGAVRAVKDKSVLRGLMRDAGIAPVRFGVAATAAEARALLDTVGLPAVFKPRALGGSAGVALVRSIDEVEAAFALAAGARVGTVRSAYDGVLVEEYVDGPELSVDSVSIGGVTTPLVVAEKQVGFAPYFEELGHMVPARPEFAGPEVLELVRRAHEVAGLTDAVTHTEIRMGAHGPRLIELNARLGGDLIPYLGQLASGVDLAGAAADIALGVGTVPTPRANGAAAVRFVYPVADARIGAVALAGALPHVQLDRFEVLVGEGTELRLPPRGFMSRLALAVVRAADRAGCLAALDDVERDLVVQADPLAVASGRDR